MVERVERVRTRAFLMPSFCIIRCRPAFSKVLQPRETLIHQLCEYEFKNSIPPGYSHLETESSAADFQMSANKALAAASSDRKARLAALKTQSLKRKARPDEDLNDAGGTEPPSESVSKLYLSGRNYDTTTRGPKLGFEERPDELEVNKKNLENQAAVLKLEAEREQEEAREEAERDAQVDLLRLRPKRQNWDLKREYLDRTRTLEQRTEIVLRKLVRQRIEQQKQEKLASLNGNSLEDREPVTGFESGADLAEAVRHRELEEEEDAKREKELDEAEYSVPDAVESPAA